MLLMPFIYLSVFVKDMNVAQPMLQYSVAFAALHKISVAQGHDGTEHEHANRLITLLLSQQQITSDSSLNCLPVGDASTLSN